jgi:CDP-glycerol glycerophosphotransferase
MAGRRIRDVSDHLEIGELYLAADLLVTDYSSAMFDFAVTGRPIVYFVPDLAAYRDRLRGFYFELEDEAPGPLCGSNDALIDALLARDSLTPEYADRYRAFQARFCPHDDGGAARRVVERVFAIQG